jgi:hypothetical protein
MVRNQPVVGVVRPVFAISIRKLDADLEGVVVGVDPHHGVVVDQPLRQVAGLKE